LLLAALAMVAARPVAAQNRQTQPVVSNQSEPTLAEGLARLSEKQYQQAAELLADVVARKQLALQQLIQQSGGANQSGANPSQASLIERETETLRQAMIGAGSALRQLGRYADALEFFESAVNVSRRSHQAQNGPGRNRIAAIELAAAECASQCLQHEKTMRFCEAILNTAGEPSATTSSVPANVRIAATQLWIRSATAVGQVQAAWDKFQQEVNLDSVDMRQWQELALSIGLAALSQDQPAVAQIAFRWYLKNAVQIDSEQPLDRETAILGIAWGAAKGAEPYEVAAQRLLDFVDQFPASSQNAKALYVCGGCLQRCQQMDQAAAVYRRLIDQYPQSPEAVAATSELLRIAPDTQLTPEINQLMRTAIASEQVQGGSVESMFLLAASQADAELWSRTFSVLASSPQAQRLVAQTLRRLDAEGFPSDAERLATQVLSSKMLAADNQGQASATEQACRWAAAKSHWDMLAMAGKEAVATDFAKQLVDHHDSLSLRLMAEGAVQDNDLSTAKILLDQLIQGLGIRDFDTLLRRAEVALALESKEAANQAIEAVEQLAGGEGDRALATMLRAQWFIRDARMIDARDALDRIVRGSDVSKEIRARAQWLLGETYFLQRQYTDAIDHYRLVESLDDGGSWTAAALIQAGRCFEQLGMQREAAVCYTGLLSRFGSSPHVSVAQARLAALSGSGNSEPQNSATQNKIR
jgi:TolA-binding protein